MYSIYLLYFRMDSDRYRNILLIPYFFIVMAFSMAIPNILSTALIHYKSETGSAGALLGLIYYILIGSGLIAIGFIQNWELRVSCFLELEFVLYCCLGTKELILKH